jgi:hypothetical protein
LPAALAHTRVPPPTGPQDRADAEAKAEAARLQLLADAAENERQSQMQFLCDGEQYFWRLAKHMNVNVFGE